MYIPTFANLSEEGVASSSTAGSGSPADPVYVILHGARIVVIHDKLDVRDI